MTLNLSMHDHSRDPQNAPTVRDAQNRLLAKGYPVGRNGADGAFGPDTDSAVRRYQAHEGLTKDGVIGPNTWKLLVASDPRRVPVTEAKRFADLCYKLVTQGIDGTPPRYVFGGEVSMHDPSPDALDCSELVQWGVTQIDKKTWVDGSRNQYAESVHCSVGHAIQTKGALLFITGNGSPSGIHHVAVSMGNGKTAEARSAHTIPQVGSWDATHRFQYGALIPILRY